MFAPVLPQPIAETLASVRALDEAPRPVTAEDRAAWLAGLRELIDVAEVEFTRTLAEFDAAGDGEVLHASASTPAWLRGALGMAGGEAAERVRLARASTAELDQSLQRVATDHSMSFDHVRAIGKGLGKLPASVKPEAAATLTELAPNCSVDQLRAAGRHLRNVIDPDGALAAAEADFGRRWLSMAPLLDGMSAVQGVLDAEATAVVGAALAPFLVPAGADDDRTAAQRRADGLAEIARVAVASQDTPQLSGATAAIAVTARLASLTGDDSTPAALSGHSGIPTWIPIATAQRLSCDAAIRRVLINPDGVPLDLGRAKRIYSHHQRAALAIRDQGCRFPGCTRPAAYTDAHHLTPWTHGGTTDLNNGLLLCRHHHRAVHEQGWSITPADPDKLTNGQLIFTGPQGQTHTSRPPPDG